MRNREYAQSGNVFAIILVGVVLFAALAFTFSRNVSQGTGQLTSRQASILSSEIMDYGFQLERVVQKLLRNGCSESDLSFHNTVISGHSNTDTPTDGSCAIYDANGGNVTKTDLSGFNDGSEYLFTAHFDASQANTISTNADLLFMVPNINLDVCNNINESREYDNYPAIPEENALPVTATSNVFTGSFNDASAADFDCSDAGGGVVCDDQVLCARDGSGNAYYYHVLISR